MTERFEFGESQRRNLPAQAPASLESAMMAALLGERPMQQGLEPYQGLYKVREHVDGLQDGRSLGHFVIGDMQMSQFTFALLFPMIEVAPSVSFVEWTIEHFRPDIAPIVPEEAPFAEHRFRTEPRQAKLQRRGTAVSMTANIMNTAEGMARINTMLLKMAATMLNTFEFLTIQMLVTAHDGPMFRNKMTLGKYEEHELMGQLEYDATRFAAYARDPEIEVPEDMSDVVRLLNEYVAGPYAVLIPIGTQKNMRGQVLDRPDNLKIKTMNSSREIIQMESAPSTTRLNDGSLVFTVKDHGYGRRGQRAQPLLRSTWIGEHYPMTGVKCDDLARRTGVQLQGGGFATCERDIHIYDVEQDQDIRISFREAFSYSKFLPEHDDGTHEAMMMQNYGNYYKDIDFGPGGEAHPQFYWEDGVKYVRHFGQYRREIARPEIHRRVGNTIAAAIRKGHNDIGYDLQHGMDLMRELADAPHNESFLSALAKIYASPNAPVPIEDHARYPGVRMYRQGSTGFGNLTQQQLLDLAESINEAGTPPYMASVGGVHLLATVGLSSRVEGRAAELGRRATKLLRAARNVFGYLRNVFPGAIALDHRYAPLNYQGDDGFATFFTTVFLNSTFRPLIFDGVATPFSVPPHQAAEIATAQVVRADGGQPENPGFAAIGSALNPLAPDQDAGAAGLGGMAMFAGMGATVPAHARTPWMQHELMRQAQSQQGLRAAGRAAQRGRLAYEDDDDDDDIFGTARTAFRNARPAGAGVEGFYGQGRGRADRNRPLGQNRDLDNEVIPTDSNFRDTFDAADVIEDQLVRVGTLVYLTAPCTSMADFMRMMDADILVPFDLLIVRPALENEMYSIIVVAPGMDTSFHAISDTVVDFGKNVDYQIRRMTFSVRHAPILIAPDHVAILPSRIPHRYIAGGGTAFFESPEQFGWTEQRPDLISFVVPMDHMVRNVEPMGHIDTFGLHGTNGAARFPGARVYEAEWRLSEQAQVSRSMGNHWNTAGQEVPGFTWVGRVLDSNKNLIKSSQGHRRDGDHPGCRRVWMGNQALFPKSHDTPIAA